MKEAEDTFLSFRGKPVASTGTRSSISSPNIIRIKDFKLQAYLLLKKTDCHILA